MSVNEGNLDGSAILLFFAHVAVVAVHSYFTNLHGLYMHHNAKYCTVLILQYILICCSWKCKGLHLVAVKAGKQFPGKQANFPTIWCVFLCTKRPNFPPYTNISQEGASLIPHFSQHGCGGKIFDTLAMGMEWNGIQWNRMEWNGMEWNEMQRNTTQCNGVWMHL